MGGYAMRRKSRWSITWADLRSGSGRYEFPCIERNAINAVKAVKRRADGDAPHLGTVCSLDKVIETMYETGKDMNDKYRETSRGGLAIKVVCG
ncbi:L-serine ammonia-lyase, iron-sulfur-dependent, subunit alpha [Escherichia coli]